MFERAYITIRMILTLGYCALPNIH